jgi:nucleotide-binding universal stress UspA family protein
MSGAGQDKIVVGVDGSDSSKQALRWAVRQAELTGASVEALTAWDFPKSLGMLAPMSDGFNPEAEAREVLTAAIEDTVGASPPVAVSAAVVRGHPALSLVAASKSASLLVVGSRGHGEFVGMMIGSVSEYCVANAACPVVVIRGPGAAHE